MSALNDSLAAIDLHMVLLKPELEGLIVPSKVYGILGVERPILFFGDRDGEIGTLVNSNGVGWTYSDSEIDRAVQQLSDVDVLRRDLADFQRSYAEDHTTTVSANSSVGKWTELLKALSTSS